MRALLVSLLLCGCFNVDQTSCAYACGPEGECPDEYQCGSDNYCHLHGTGVCLFSDAAVAPDMSVPESMVDSAVPDLVSTTD